MGFSFYSEFAEPILNNTRTSIDLSESNAMLIDASVTIFYSNGEIAMNNLGQRMPNGQDLKGSASSMYGCTIVDSPQSCDQYYLFYSESDESPSPRKVYYSVIDVNIVVEDMFFTSMGDVIPSQKNIEVTPNGVDCAESIYSIKKDILKEGAWLFTSERNTGTIFIYNLSASGVTLHKEYTLDELMLNPPGNYISNIKFDSWDIDKTTSKLLLATSGDGVANDLRIASYIFDRQSGEIIPSTRIGIDIRSTITYGTAFSPDGSKVYYTDHINKTLRQFDYKTTSGYGIGKSNHNGKSGGLKLGPNHQIYWANKYNIEPDNSPISTLSVIKSPNEAGAACNLILDDFKIEATTLPLKFGVFPSIEKSFFNPFVLAQSDATCGKVNGAAEIFANPSLLPLDIKWDNGETTHLASNLSPGLHRVEMTTLDGCYHKDSILIPELSDFIIDDLKLFSVHPSECLLSDGSINLSSSAFLIDSIYQINFTNSQNEQLELNITSKELSELSIPNLPVGKYYDFEIASTYTTCNFDFPDTLSLKGISPKPDLGNDTIICSNQIFSIYPKEDFNSYSWSDGSTIKTIEIGKSNTYILNTTDVNGCENSDSINVLFTEDFELSLTAEITLNEGDSIQLTPSVIETAILSYQWTPPDELSCADCPNPLAAPTNSTKYMLIVTDENSCSDTTTVDIQVIKYSELYIPNVFTPNGDGKNDFLGIEGGTNDIRLIKNFEIFNRWGEQIFKKSNFVIDDLGCTWNGKIHNLQASTGVYVYLVEMEFVDGRSKKLSGEFLLLR